MGGLPASVGRRIAGDGGGGVGGDVQDDNNNYIRCNSTSFSASACQSPDSLALHSVWASVAGTAAVQPLPLPTNRTLPPVLNSVAAAGFSSLVVAGGRCARRTRAAHGTPPPANRRPAGRWTSLAEAPAAAVRPRCRHRRLGPWSNCSSRVSRRAHSFVRLGRPSSARSERSNGPSVEELTQKFAGPLEEEPNWLRRAGREQCAAQQPQVRPAAPTVWSLASVAGGRRASSGATARVGVSRARPTHAIWPHALRVDCQIDSSWL